jgi:hypothetical protein
MKRRTESFRVDIDRAADLTALSADDVALMMTSQDHLRSSAVIVTVTKVEQ